MIVEYGDVGPEGSDPRDKCSEDVQTQLRCFISLEANKSDPLNQRCVFAVRNGKVWARVITANGVGAEMESSLASLFQFVLNRYAEFSP